MSQIGEIVVHKDVPATMRDGTTLAADVYRPGGENSGPSYPVLLTRLPYGKGEPNAPAYMDPVGRGGAGMSS